MFSGSGLRHNDVLNTYFPIQDFVFAASLTNLYEKKQEILFCKLSQNSCILIENLPK